MTDVPNANAAGWYPDPAGIHYQRFWTGAAWTPRVADAYGVTAVHHLDADYRSPSGEPVAAAPPKAPTPALSLVAPAESAHQPVPEALAEPEPVLELDLREAPIEALTDEPDVQMWAAPPGPWPVPGPRPAGWYTDPSGIHCERTWDGSTWGAVVVDRNRALQEHALHDAFAPPVDLRVEAPVETRQFAPFDAAPVAGTAFSGAPPVDVRNGWRPDPAGHFRERFFRDGCPSEVVRTARSRAG